MTEKYRVCFTKTTKKPTGDWYVDRYGQYYNVSTEGGIAFSEIGRAMAHYNKSIEDNARNFVEEIIYKCKLNVSKVSLELTVK